MNKFLVLAFATVVVSAELPIQRGEGYAPRGWRPDGPSFNLPARQQQQPHAEYGLPKQDFGILAKQQLPRTNYGTPEAPPPPSGFATASSSTRSGFGFANRQNEFSGFDRPTNFDQRRQFQKPAKEYGTPQQEYGPPQQETTTEYYQETTEYLSPTSTEKYTPESEQLNAEKQNNKKKDAEDVDVDDKKKNSDKLREGQEVSQQGVYYIYHPNGVLQKVVYATKDDSRNMAYTAQLKYENVEPIREPIYTYDPVTLSFQPLQVQQ